MPQGLQVFDASGNIVIDISDRLGRILGSVSTGSSSGSISVSGFADGEAWYFAQVLNALGFYPPAVTVSGTSLSWSFPTEGASPARIFYGIR